VPLPPPTKHKQPTQTQAVQLREEFNIDIRVLGIADSKGMLTSESGIDLDNWRSGGCVREMGVHWRHAGTQHDTALHSTAQHGTAAHTPALPATPARLPHNKHTNTQHLLAWESGQEESDLEAFGCRLTAGYIPNLAIIDCTASDVPPGHYLSWMKRGINIITPNKKLGSGPLEQYLAVRKMQRESYIHFFYEVRQ
jgi:homoserine dehydrogenase